MLFIYKSRLRSLVLPVDAVTYIVTNIAFLLLSAFIARHETCNFKLPKIYLAIMWFSGYDAGANIKISHAGHAKPNWLHDRHAKHAKPDVQKLGMNYQPGDRSGTWVKLGQFWAARAWTHFFHAYEMLFLSTNVPLNFVTSKYVKFSSSH